MSDRCKLPNRSYLKEVEKFLKKELSLKEVHIIESFSPKIQGIDFVIKFVLYDNSSVNFKIEKIYDYKDFEKKFGEELHGNKKVQRALKLNKINQYG